MYDYYCKNCNNIVGEWNIKLNIMDDYCFYTVSNNNKLIYFLDCKNCNKFVGLLCLHVCKNCFGKKQILNEETLFNFFLEYKKLNPCVIFDYCKNCDTRNFRCQHWFFEELNFYE